MTSSQALKILVKNKVKPSSERDLTVFAMSCIGSGYGYILKELMGFNYSILSSLGEKDHLISLLDDADTVKKTNLFIKNNRKKINKFFDDLQKEFVNLNKEFKIYCRFKNQEEFLFKLINYYPRYARVMGAYNCFWRSLSTADNKNKLSQNIINRIQRDRDKAASLYPLVEERFKKSCGRVGKKLAFKGEYLHSCTRKELKDILISGKLNRSFVGELKKRRRQYVYLYVDQTEIVFSDRKLWLEVNKEFLSIAKTNSLKGEVAYQGKVRGLVYNNNLKNSDRPKKDFVLIAPMTHPSDLPLLKKSVAFVTDEGGLLCHAAIISRELKKPCIIGTKIATKVFKNGDRVEVDADNGIIKKI